MATVAIARERGWSTEVLLGLERGPTPLTVVMHRDGGTVFAGPDDSPAARSSGILTRQGMTQATIPPFEGSDAEWRTLVRCVQDRFDGYGVRVVDQVPSVGAYSLAFVGGTPDLLGYGETIGGIATHADRVLEGSVLFVFQSEGASLRSICETTAHEIGHTLGLDHSRECTDIMSYESCGPKEFRETWAECGEWEARACGNGQAQQSSHERLAAAVGLRPRRDGAREDASTSTEDASEVRTEVVVRRSAHAQAGRPFSVLVDVGGRAVEHVDLHWYARRGHKLRCDASGRGQATDAMPFACEREGSVFTFTVTPDRAGLRKFVAVVDPVQGRVIKTPTYEVRLQRAGAGR